MSKRTETRVIHTCDHCDAAIPLKSTLRSVTICPENDGENIVIYMKNTAVTMDRLDFCNIECAIEYFTNLPKQSET